MRLAALVLASLSLSADPMVAQEAAPRSLIDLDGDCASLITWDLDQSADCQDGLLVRKYADGRIHFAVAITPECCALNFEGDEASRRVDGGSVVQPIKRVSLHRAGTPPFIDDGVGDCRWAGSSAGATPVTCEFVSNHDGRSTRLLFITGSLEPDVRRF